MARAILFDIDGVLIHPMFHLDETRRRTWHQHMKADLGVTPEDFHAFFGEKFAPVIRGDKAIIPELAKFLPTIGYSGTAMNFLAYWLKHDNQLNLPLLDAIKKLSKNPEVEVYLATNQEHLRAFHLWTTFGFSHIFSDMFYAANLGAAKPDIDYFNKVDALLGTQTQPPLFFDDSAKNVQAANAHGWEAVLFDVTHDFTNHPWVARRL